jgi:hypothetical protein
MLTDTDKTPIRFISAVKGICLSVIRLFTYYMRAYYCIKLLKNRLECNYVNCNKTLPILRIVQMVLKF